VLNPEMSSGLLREAHNELRAATSLAEQRVKRWRYQLQMFKMAHDEARGPVEKSVTFHQLKQCEGKLRLCELDRDGVAEALRLLEGGIAVCRSAGRIGGDGEVATRQ
jgi:hypothetical protein